MRSQTSRRACGSSPVVGSSRIEQPGLVQQRARQHETAAHAAGERLDALAAVIAELRERDQLLGALRGRARRDAEVAGVDEQVLLDAQVGVEAVLLRHHAHLRLDPARGRGTERQAEDPHLAGGRHREAGEHPDGRRLPGSVRTEQADALPRLDAEAQIDDRLALAEPLGERTGLHDGSGHVEQSRTAGTSRNSMLAQRATPCEAMRRDGGEGRATRVGGRGSARPSARHHRVRLRERTADGPPRRARDARRPRGHRPLHGTARRAVRLPAEPARPGAERVLRSHRAHGAGGRCPRRAAAPSTSMAWSASRGGCARASSSRPPPRPTPTAGSASARTPARRTCRSWRRRATPTASRSRR